MAAKSELEDRDSSESARHLFLRALRFHPNNQKVYQEVKGKLLHNVFARGYRILVRPCNLNYILSYIFKYFRMELLHCEKLRKQKEELEKAEVDLVSLLVFG